MQLKNSTIRDRREYREGKRKDKNRFITFCASRTFVHIILVFWAFISMFPFIWAFIASFNSPSELADIGINPIPDNWTTGNYVEIFSNNYLKDNFGTWFANGMIFAVLTASLNVFFNFLAGYGLARIHFKGKNLVLWYFIVGMMIPGQICQWPQLVILVKMGFMDANVPTAIWFIGITFTGMTSAMFVFLIRQVFLTRGNSAEEAATMDGLSTFGAFFKISLRMMIPLMATQWAMIFMGSWNNFVQFVLWSGGRDDRMNLVSAFGQIGGAFNDPNLARGVTLAASNLSIIPPLLVYLGSLYFQKKTLIEGEK